MAIICNNILKSHYINFELIQSKRYLFKKFYFLYNQDELIYFLDQLRI
jgi:hypothetical protein